METPSGAFTLGQTPQTPQLYCILGRAREEYIFGVSLKSCSAHGHHALQKFMRHLLGTTSTDRLTTATVEFSQFSPLHLNTTQALHISPHPSRVSYIVGQSRSI